ncbi:phosphate acyltransferase PlsX [Sneathiella chungangensis]|uniref:Phosphate acyltransferase n=1 Tax=Sneathiella chungangensis TaxID=1418234 RepID=A0A845MCA7_9PROT|nr:phosphate acyltransferase PlsX [Sneathiella chungangensis]MZR21499.1 phosphate acyltransferase PlsX [Sneathiella chungangensis]
MPENIVIALDAMGGDHAPDIVVKGIDIIRVQFPKARFLLFGDQVRLEPLLKAHPGVRGVCELRHTDEAVKSEDKPSQALRKGRKSSMRLAIDAVRDGEAGAVVSAGNTGALMAMAKVSLRMMAGIDRPAIASVLPSPRGETVMLDLGANIECDADNLVQFAFMGADFARAVLGRVPPRVALLNVGIEELKGNDTIREAGERLKSIENAPFDYHGFVEGDDITRGVVDVIVTDGFTGNIALKTAEGVVRLFTDFLRAGFKSSLMSRIGYLFARGGLNILRERLDPRVYNGGVLLGLNGLCVKSHGGTDETGFANAIGVAIEMVSDDMIDKMRSNFETFDMAEKMSNNTAGSGNGEMKQEAAAEPASTAAPKRNQPSGPQDDAG